MKLTINGSNRTLSDCSTVTQLLHQLELSGKRIAVEINGHLIYPNEFESTPIKDHDQIEIVHAVGGGLFA